MWCGRCFRRVVGSIVSEFVNDIDLLMALFIVAGIVPFIPREYMNYAIVVTLLSVIVYRLWRACSMPSVAHVPIAIAQSMEIASKEIWPKLTRSVSEYGYKLYDFKKLEEFGIRIDPEDLSVKTGVLSEEQKHVDEWYDCIDEYLDLVNFVQRLFRGGPISSCHIHLALKIPTALAFALGYVSKDLMVTVWHYDTSKHVYEPLREEVAVKVRDRVEEIAKKIVVKDEVLKEGRDVQLVVVYLRDGLKRHDPEAIVELARSIDANCIRYVEVPEEHLDFTVKNRAASSMAEMYSEALVDIIERIASDYRHTHLVFVGIPLAIVFYIGKRLSRGVNIDAVHHYSIQMKRYTLQLDMKVLEEKRRYR